MTDINFKVTYTPERPLTGDNPRIVIFGDKQQRFQVRFIDKQNPKHLFAGICETNQSISGKRQWFTDWLIEIVDEKGNVVHSDEFDPTFKTVFIKIDGYALGDNIAWIPYVEEFRKKYNCTMICSTFWNQFFIHEYPEILFVEPNVKISNVYTQIFIGANEANNTMYSPIKSIDNPLQKVASEILGLDYKEIKPKFSLKYQQRPNFKRKYVTISEFGSAPTKSWGNSWQPIVDYLNTQGYLVVVISKEPTNLVNVINKTGDIKLGDRLIDIEHAEFHLGVSSGLSWVAWALGTHVVMVSDYTPHYHEFQTNITRIGTNFNGIVDYVNVIPTTTEFVIDKISRLV